MTFQCRSNSAIEARIPANIDEVRYGVVIDPFG